MKYVLRCSLKTEKISGKLADKIRESKLQKVKVWDKTGISPLGRWNRQNKLYMFLGKKIRKKVRFMSLRPVIGTTSQIIIAEELAFEKNSLRDMN